MRGAILRRLYNVPLFQVRQLAQQSRGKKILHEAMDHFGGCPSVCGSNLWRFTTLTFYSRSFLGEKPHSECQLWYLFHQFGASTRALTIYGAHPDQYEEQLRRYIDGINPDDLPYIFQNPASSKNSHLIITIYPQEGSPINFEKKFASRRVFDMVWEKHLSRRIDLMREFYYQLLTKPIAAIPAGWAFENRTHQLLRREQTLRLFPILPHTRKTNIIFDKYTTSEAKNTPTEFQLTSSEEYRLVARANLQANQYCRPESSNFAAVDSVLLIHPPSESPILFMFQMAQNKTKHDAKLSGLQKAEGLVVPPDTHKYLVIVTPANIHPCITVPLEYFGRTVDIQSEDTEDTDEAQGEEMDDDQGDTMGGAQWALFRVFHYPVDMDRLFDP